MPYASLLNQLIENAGISNKELCDACAEEGIKLTPAYISLLRNPLEQRTASESVSRALARALGEENEQLLVIQAYLDKAPECLRDLKSYFRDYMSSAISAELAEDADDIQRSVLMDDYKKLPFAELFSEFTDTVIGKFVMQLQSNDSADPIKSSMELVNQIESENNIEVRDNAMAPLIVKGSRVLFSRAENMENYKTGDLVCFFRKDESRILVRRLAILETHPVTFAMIPQNPNYQTQQLSASEVVLMGKVKQVTTEF
ncbi:MAG TPA: hypothetical protein DEQ02_05335 [Ruminococcaceae bacterium]|nr:hypothetical protein [Oscillospiraceae bacterium]